jgi:hypothetical protein
LLKKWGVGENNKNLCALGGKKIWSGGYVSSVFYISKKFAFLFVILLFNF